MKYNVLKGNEVVKKNLSKKQAEEYCDKMNNEFKEKQESIRKQQHNAGLPLRKSKYELYKVEVVKESKIVRLTESDLIHIVKRVLKEQEEEQSFSDKLKQKLLFFKPFKFTDDRKLKLFKFITNEIKKGEYSDGSDLGVFGNVDFRIYSNKEIIIDGIKTHVTVNILVNKSNIKSGKISPKDVYISLPQFTKGNGSLNFMNENDPEFNEFSNMVLDIFKSNKKHMGMLNKKINYGRTSKVEKKKDDDDVSIWYYLDTDNDSSDDTGGFQGFGGGKFGGGGAGSSW